MGSVPSIRYIQAGHLLDAGGLGGHMSSLSPELAILTVLIASFTTWP